ncbi:S8 family serine peptidase [Pontibacter mangrovi]|uniref:T9SS type A sorting domain-containing protein n=1 Tax=Pontibacter mangrovi TaxID=2589816 RepID=A0A501W7E7_9BACT|nr:S8 family serine peptidase [Pontibacter mangrovi]TPE43171.1 T9SS type A sorting domain-containing protein [Pontibacter mangrovi]
MRLLLLFICLLLYLPVSAQDAGNTDGEGQKRLLYFADKHNSPYSLSKPLEFLSPKALERRKRQNISLTTRDLPVNPAYVAALKDAGIKVWYTSRWFNAAVVQCSDEQLQQLETLPFIKRYRTLNRLPIQTEELHTLATQHAVVDKSDENSLPVPDREGYNLAFHQADMLGADELHAQGFAGSGITIAVLDAGFPNVDKLQPFSHLFEDNRLKATFDFVLKQENVFGADSHGTAVLSTMAAYAPGLMIGTAYDANYMLFRTEDAASEHNIEEVNWLMAAEFADSAGADVINSSLGYTTFDSPSQSYSYADMDGNTTIVSRAADFAAATGMLVVVSAGNEGNKAWRYISAPADADSVLAVGAVDSLGVKARFSSMGPTADGAVKPDVVAMGQRVYFLNASGGLAQGNGTSFAGPIMAGFAASLWQEFPDKSNMELLKLIRRSGSNAATPDNSIGYGIPTYERVLSVLPLLEGEVQALITNPVYQEQVILYLAEEWLQQAVEVQVLDATGKEVFAQRIQQPAARQALALQPQALQAGLYLCRVRSGSSVLTLRFIKL